MNRITGYLANDFEELRLITKIVTLYYRRGMKQAEIAKELGLSRSKVNRLFAIAHENGIVEIKINSPMQLTSHYESRLSAIFDISDVIVVPAVLEDAQSLIDAIGAATGRYLQDHIRDGDKIAVGGGTTMLSLVRQLVPDRSYNVKVLPIEGGLKGNIVTDVNYVVSELARLLGGTAQALHAPAFLDSAEERDLLINLSDISQVLELARKADIVIFGMGHCNENSRYAMFTGLSVDEMCSIREKYGGVGEIGSMIYDIRGKPTGPEFANRVVGLSLQDLKNIPLKIGIAGTPEKALPIYAALVGGYIDILVTDELAAKAVLEIFDREFHKK